ncbi:MAG: baseplate J/gp47 family protein [Treponema sp.]|nr:baseplate J/gp47 family protein [Treponema sp.]
MPFRRESLATLSGRISANYESLFRPLDRSPRHSLLKVFSSVDAGIYHQLLGDLEFLSRQIFPDTAEGEFLRQHWSSKVPPLHAAAASGEVLVSGISGRNVPAGLLFGGASGERYYSESIARIADDGSGRVNVRAQNPGSAANLAAGDRLIIVSGIPPGVDSTATVGAGGISGGTDAESEEEYLVRVLAFLRNPARYGKGGDFAAWAADATAEVSAAWEFRNFGPLGALLIQVINGNQRDGVRPVGGLDIVRDYISAHAPPVLFTVRSPEMVPLSPSVSIPEREDFLANRELVESRMRAWLQLTAKPGVQVTSGALRLAVIDGVTITDAQVRLNGDAAGLVKTTILEYPYLKELIWE